MIEKDFVKKSVIEKLTEVIDPETGVDVISMGLITHLEVSDPGFVDYTFEPSSPLCPIAVFLALNIIHAINNVEGVTGQNITVENYVQEEELNKLLKSAIETLNK